MTEKYKKHQSELAQSGYILPDTFYIEGEEPGESAEEKSGDGGVKAGDVKQKSEHGYQGELRSREELADMNTVDPETGQTLGDAIAEQVAATAVDQKGADNTAAKRSKKATGK
jgi:hypothetical protein